MTNLTPAQLEQFESTFRYFDKDESNTLSQTEMTAALASLGIVYSVRIAVLRRENPSLTVEYRTKTWTSSTNSSWRTTAQ